MLIVRNHRPNAIYGYIFLEFVIPTCLKAEILQFAKGVDEQLAWKYSFITVFEFLNCPPMMIANDFLFIGGPP